VKEPPTLGNREESTIEKAKRLAPKPKRPKVGEVDLSAPDMDTEGQLLPVVRALHTDIPGDVLESTWIYLTNVLFSSPKKKGKERYTYRIGRRPGEVTYKLYQFDEQMIWQVICYFPHEEQAFELAERMDSPLIRVSDRPEPKKKNSTAASANLSVDRNDAE
jgi:hypothetical protein